MKSVFLNDPKPPKGLVFWGSLVLICLGIALQIGLYHKALSPIRSRKVPVPTEEAIFNDSAGTEQIPPIPLSVSDEDDRLALDEFFGPLPATVNEPAPLKKCPPVRGVYIQQGESLEDTIELARDTEINAVVLNVKESWGLTYESTVPLAQEIGASQGELDLSGLIQKCHDNGLQVIARMVCFKDEMLAAERPDLCLQNEEGDLLTYPLEGNESFANPYDPKVWEYLCDIALEVCEMGVDQIQLDYVRFPTGEPDNGKIALENKTEGYMPSRSLAINRFLETIRIRVQEATGIPVTADLFSIVFTSPGDGEAIGQDPLTIGLTGLYRLCPMIYPSHYANASSGPSGNGTGSYIGESFFDAPDLSPGEVVRNVLLDAKKSFRQPGYSFACPWLQAFTANWLTPGFYREYGAPEIREQIQQVYDAGWQEWILWSPVNSYPKGAFLNKSDLPVSTPTEDDSMQQNQGDVSTNPQESRRRFPIAEPRP